MSEATVKGYPRSFVIKWLVSLAITAIILLIPSNEVYTYEVKVFVAITALSMLMMAMELAHNLVAALLLQVGYLIFKVAPADVVFSAWSNQIPWLVLGSFIVAAIMERTGLSQRIAYFCMLKARGRFGALMFASFIAGVIISAFVSASIARTAMLCALMLSLCQAMDYKAFSREAACAFFVAYVASCDAGLIFMTGGNATLVLVGVLQQTGYDVTFIDYFLKAGIPNLVLDAICVFVAIKFFGPKKGTASSSEEYIKEQYAKLGPTSKDEKKTIVLLLVLIALLLTSSIHGLEAGWVFIIIAWVAFLPGINLADKTTVSKVNFTMVFLIAATVTIGNVSSHLNLGNTIVETILPYIPTNKIGVCMMVMLIGILGNMAMTPLALASTFTEPIIQLALSTGFNPYGIAYIFLIACYQLFFPYEITNALVMYGYGMVNMKETIKYFTVKMIIAILFVLVAVIPYFTMIGIL